MPGWTVAERVGGFEGGGGRLRCSDVRAWCAGAPLMFILRSRSQMRDWMSFMRERQAAKSFWMVCIISAVVRGGEFRGGASIVVECILFGVYSDWERMIDQSSVVEVCAGRVLCDSRGHMWRVNCRYSP